MSHIDTIESWYAIKTKLYPVIFSPIPHNPSLIIKRKKKSDKFQLRDILEHTWPLFFKILRSSKQWNSEKYSQEDARAT